MPLNLEDQQKPSASPTHQQSKRWKLPLKKFKTSIVPRTTATLQVHCCEDNSNKQVKEFMAKEQQLSIVESQDLLEQSHPQQQPLFKSDDDEPEIIHEPNFESKMQQQHPHQSNPTKTLSPMPPATAPFRAHCYETHASRRFV